MACRFAVPHRQCRRYGMKRMSVVPAPYLQYQPTSFGGAFRLAPHSLRSKVKEMSFDGGE